MEGKKEGREKGTGWRRRRRRTGGNIGGGGGGMEVRRWRKDNGKVEGGRVGYWKKWRRRREVKGGGEGGKGWRRRREKGREKESSGAKAKDAK